MVSPPLIIAFVPQADYNENDLYNAHIYFAVHIVAIKRRYRMEELGGTITV